jgi:hypothetical protein
MPAVEDIEKEIKNDVRAAQKMRLPRWGLLSVIAGSALSYWLFDHFGRLDLGLPILNGIGTLVFALALKWKLRRNAWFWITITVIAALHVPLILFVPWTTKWVPPMAIAAIDSADLIVILAMLAVVENLFGRAGFRADSRDAP